LGKWVDFIYGTNVCMHDTNQLRLYLYYIVLVRYFSSGCCSNWTAWTNPGDLGRILDNLFEEWIQCHCPVTLYIGWCVYTREKWSYHEVSNCATSSTGTAWSP